MLLMHFRKPSAREQDPRGSKPSTVQGPDYGPQAIAVFEVAADHSIHLANPKTIESVFETAADTSEQRYLYILRA